MMNVSKRISILLCAVFMTLCSTSAVFAESAQKLIDDASMFSSSEKTDIVEKLEDAKGQTGWDIVIYTNENNVSGSRMESYCNNYYDKSGFADSGVLLTVDMGSRKMYMITKGDAMMYLSDSRNDAILDEVQSYLADGDYYEAAVTFIDSTVAYYNAGMPDYSSGNETHNNVYINEKQDNPVIYALVHYGIASGIAGVVIALITVLVIRSKYKHNGKSGTYDLHQNSVTKLSVSDDVFLTKHVSVRVIQTSSSSGGRSSGGGSSHGGGGRSF